MERYVPKKLQQSVSAEVGKTLGQLKQQNIEIPWKDTKVYWRNTPYYNSYADRNNGNVYMGFTQSQLQNPVKFIKSYNANSNDLKLFNYKFIAGHEPAHLGQSMAIYKNENDAPQLIPQINQSGEQRMPVSQYIYGKGDSYYSEPWKEYTDQGMFQDLGKTRDVTAPGIPNTVFHQNHLKDPGELDADLYALKNMGYIKDGKISDEASKWLQVRHNLSPEGLKSSLEDLDAIGYAQPLSLKNPQELTSHLQGNEAVKMFKEYGGIEIPKESKLGDQLRQYVYQARKQYGLLGNKDISDEEIAQSLYKEMMQNKSGAITDSGEPMIGFRGDTKQYSELIPRKTAEQYEKTPSGSADNVLGTLFLGEYPNKDLGLGSERYLNGYTPTSSESYLHPTPNSTYVKASPEEGLIKWDTNDPHYYIRNNQLLSLIKNEKVADGHWVGSRFIPNDGNVNDINAFMFKSNGVLDKTGKINPETRSTSEAYRYQDMVNEANKKNIGLIKSDPNEILEHENYTYIALPNFNLMGAKHILPYDLRIPRNWKDPNIYRSLLPVGIGLGATSLYKKKQGGKLIPKGSYISK